MSFNLDQFLRQLWSPQPEYSFSTAGVSPQHHKVVGRRRCGSATPSINSSRAAALIQHKQRHKRLYEAAHNVINTACQDARSGNTDYCDQNEEIALRIVKEHASILAEEWKRVEHAKKELLALIKHLTAKKEDLTSKVECLRCNENHHVAKILALTLLSSVTAKLRVAQQAFTSLDIKQQDIYDSLRMAGDVLEH